MAYDEDSPLTVAGAAAALEKFPRTAFPFDPRQGNRHNDGRILGPDESMPLSEAQALTSRRTTRRVRRVNR